MSSIWLQSPYLNLEYVATKLYGSKSRLHTQQLRRKMKGSMPFESWEIERLQQIKNQLAIVFQVN